MRIRSLLVPAAPGAGSIVASGTSFAPAGTQAGQGTTVTWSFQGGTHTTRSDQGFRSGGARSSGTFGNGMTSAGIP